MMSSKKKRSKLESSKTIKHLEREEEREGEDSYSDSSNSSSVESDLEIQMDFEACGIDQDDYHGIRRLLQQLLLKTTINLSEISTHIINQSHIGSTIKTCEEDCTDDSENVVYGITTVLVNEGQSHFKELFDYLIDSSQQYTDSETSEKLKSLLSGEGGMEGDVFGVVFHERFLNIPVDIGPPLLKCLIDEIKTGLKTIPTHLVIITRSHSFPLALQKKKKKGKSSLTTNAHTPSSELIFDFPEMEYFKKECIMQYSYPMPEGHDSVQSGKWSYDDQTLVPYRTVLILSYVSFCNTVDILCSDFKVNLS